MSLLRLLLLTALAAMAPPGVERAVSQSILFWQGSDAAEPFGAEDPHSENDVPRIPEPMVFDLVRSLGARRGELEVNTLALFPLRRLRGPASGDPAAFERRAGTAWAPEIEYALFDDFAVEFELPCEDSQVEAYKAAAQYTFGTSLNNAYVHGCQMIFEQVLDPGVSELTLLYLAGIQFDERWSALAMAGFRTFMGRNEPDENAAGLFNLSIFYHLCQEVTVGIETNRATFVDGAGSLLVMPQLHWEVTDHVMMQLGCGAEFVDEESLPIAGLRAIYTF